MASFLSDEVVLNFKKKNFTSVSVSSSKEGLEQKIYIVLNGCSYDITSLPESYYQYGKRYSVVISTLRGTDSDLHKVEDYGVYLTASDDNEYELDDGTNNPWGLSKSDVFGNGTVYMVPNTKKIHIVVNVVQNKQRVTITGGNPLFGISDGSIVLEVGKEEDITAWMVSESYTPTVDMASVDMASVQTEDGIMPMARDIVKWYVTKPLNKSENIQLTRDDSFEIIDQYGDAVIVGMYRASLTHISPDNQPFISFDTQAEA